MKTISTLVRDIEGLFQGANLASLKEFGADLADNIDTRFRRYSDVRPRKLYLSNVGKPLRQLWFELKSGLQPEPLPPASKMKFLFGDILEDLLIMLAIEAGHTVTHLQAKVEVDGVPGRIDCLIDRVLIDVKSASNRAFAKFKTGALRNDDPFGYIGQLSGYSYALGGIDAAFLVINKESGYVTLLEFTKEELAEYNIQRRITDARKMLEQDTPPETLCYEPVPDGKSGNLKLPVGCSYCAFKFHCHPEVRTFLYSNGPVYLTKVVHTPRVFEVKGDHGQHDRQRNAASGRESTSLRTTEVQSSGDGE